ncbi:MaoC family dehydratase [Acrocarpospora pleiomorpha]|uniref:MaoC family dehydratase n=1 Tax=Acrocarpospora pleiomorpha TaxID=90975 RepID=A0A5M3XKS3_9ACTN|nr:MaoC/PaaZ C-terminal domain-containing protein [Acrocarpospora pleiomorpha]GES21550.1 MaoC family dehydratase [Acrocarpospora pleiomorpha]
MRLPLYFDDLEVGQRWDLPGRTVTETDLVSFAMLSGDWNPIHTDETFAASSHFGTRVVYGLLGVVMLTGFLDRSGLFTGSAVAALGIKDWQYKKAFFIGDTIRGRLEIVGLRLTSSGTQGVVERHFTLLDQHDDVVSEGRLDSMIRVSPEAVILA